MQIIECEQRTEQWYQARVGMITASKFADVLAKGRGNAESKTRNTYIRQIAIERLTGLPLDNYTNPYMEYGCEMEEEAREAYTLQTGNTVEQVGFCKHDDWVGVSPDGLVGWDGLCEIKCPKTETHFGYIWGDSIPKSYYAQMQGQMWVTGRQWCDFVSYDRRVDVQPLFIQRILRDDKFIAELQDGIQEFIHGNKGVIEHIKKIDPNYILEF